MDATTQDPPMNEQTMKVGVGIFVLSAVIFLFVLALLFGGFPHYFKQVDLYPILLDDATGISPGTPVRRSGVKIGEVRSVELDPETGTVRVIIQVDKGFPMRGSYEPTVTRSLLGGDASIDLLPREEEPAPAEKIDKKERTEAEPPRVVPAAFFAQVEEVKPAEKKKGDEVVPPGTPLKGRTRTDAGRLVEETRDLIPPARDALLELERLLARANRMTPEIEAAIGEFRGVAKTIGGAVPELRQTNEELRDLIKTTRQAVPEVRRTGEEIQQTARTWNKVGERVDLLIRGNEEKLEKAVEQANEALRRVNDLLSDENRRYVNETLKNAYKGSEKFDDVLQSTEELLKISQLTMKNLNEVVLKADRSIAGLPDFGKMFERNPVIMKNLEESSVLLNKTLADVRELLHVVARSDGTVSKLIHDPSLYNNVNDSARMVTHLLPRMERILSDVEIFADKIARRPEVLGVGGALRPSSGLKESPSVIPWRVIPTGGQPVFEPVRNGHEHPHPWR